MALMKILPVKKRPEQAEKGSGSIIIVGLEGSGSAISMMTPRPSYNAAERKK
jgi:hypothetical protein